MQIFDDIDRTDFAPSPLGETEFPYLNRAADKAFERVRALMEEWFSFYPSGDLPNADAREEMRGRFRSGDQDDFTSAFWELYLHEAHRRAGYVATPHPDTPTGARIDFLMEKGDRAFYLEATALMSSSLTGGSYAPGATDVLSKLNEAFDPDFWVAVQIIVPAGRAPSTGSVTGPVERWLGSLDWADVVRRCDEGSEPHPVAMIQLGARWQVELRAYPKPEHRRKDRTTPMIVAYPHIGGMSSARDDIYAKLKGKASKYGVLDAPYVIALHALPVEAEELDIENALFGSEVVRYSTDPEATGSAELARAADGLWQWGSEHRATRVSAVLGAVEFGTYSVVRRWPRLWSNPWAKRPLDASDLPWPKSEPDLTENVLCRRETRHTPAAFFGLPADWPGRPFRDD